MSWDLDTLRQRLTDRTDDCRGCGSLAPKPGLRPEARRCWLEDGHTDRPHVRITHQFTRDDGPPTGLAWAEWTDEEALWDLRSIDADRLVCPHDAGDRVSCADPECRAWRAKVIDGLVTISSLAAAEAVAS